MLSIRKILQALFYIQSRVPENNEDKTSRMFLLKMIYFADRYHLRHYGFLGSDDEYFAMRKGPVASATYDILKRNMPHAANSVGYEFLEDIIDLDDENNVLIKTQEDDELSESFKEALDFSIKTFGVYSAQDLSRISHDYPEWKKHEGEIRKNPYSRYLMQKDDFFEDSKLNTNLKAKGIEKDPFADDSAFLDTMREKID